MQVVVYATIYTKSFAEILFSQAILSKLNYLIWLVTG